ncbi:heterokaryon incompatibility protein-domain-containing protein [Penicillium angulare]|uniref:Heterokaryon incompatibility protein-domain-containing protein n=1 Tax=Penicillium angulare TaxID=116970 RepID=A0A9W9G7S6_9EURO|nr:heterokaryon incompatibility protein-domain-containing protein [Penicillium angulare]
MASFTYQSLPGKPNITRMIRLLPNKNENAPIECSIFDYDLSEGGNRAHSYEAISYCWGSNVKSEEITLSGCSLHVTRNLHAALLYLRDNQLERTFWIDAICINQADMNEKMKQIPLMRSIYAQATQVNVWLGEGSDGGEEALEGICSLAEPEQDQNKTEESIAEYRDACLKLLKRDWFHRIWVLQEVGVARSVWVICGSVQISGQAFCEGLSKLQLPLDFLTRVGSVAYLISGASFRPKYKIDSAGSLSIGELVGLYCNRQATEQHDKIYALLGLSTDPRVPSLQPNYETPWHEILKNVASYTFPESAVQTWDGIESAIIEGKGWILGNVHNATNDKERYGHQKIAIDFSETAKTLRYDEKWESVWVVRACAELIQDGDIIYLMQGLPQPSIVRLCNDHFVVITPAVTPKKSSIVLSSAESDTADLQDILLRWKIPTSEARAELEASLPLAQMTPDFRESNTKTQSRLNNIALIMAGMVKQIQESKHSEDSHENKTIERIVEQSGKCVPGVEILRALAGYEGPQGIIAMKNILQRRGDGVEMTEEVVKAAVSNKSQGFEMLSLLLEYGGQKIPISEEILVAASRGKPSSIRKGGIGINNA